MTRMIAIVTGVVALCISGASPVSASADGPPSGKIEIEVVTVNGSGCKPGTATVTVAQDKMAFTVTYQDFRASAGGDADSTDSRKNCQVNLIVRVPEGFTYAIARTTYRGFARLHADADGLQQASYYFQGMSETTSSSHAIEGAFDDTWQFTDDISDLIFKPCGIDRNLNINSELRVNPGTSDPGASSFMSMDSSRGSFSGKFYFAWRNC